MKNEYEKINNNMLKFALKADRAIYGGSYSDGTIKYSVITDGVTAYACPDALCRVRVDGLRWADFNHLFAGNVDTISRDPAARVALPLPEIVPDGNKLKTVYLVADTLALNKKYIDSFGPGVQVFRAPSLGMFYIYNSIGFCGVVMACRVSRREV